MTTSNIQEQLRANAPAYCELMNDGANFKCVECGFEGKASLFWYVVTPDTKKRVICKDLCIDADWLAKAAKIAGKI